MTITNRAAWQGEYEKATERQIGAQVQDRKREAGILLMRKLQLKSPVDTGNFRNRWHFSSPAPNEADLLTEDPYTKLLQLVVNPLDWREQLWIQNNTPYGPVLEYGLFDPPSPGPSKDPRPGRFGRVLVQGGFSVQAPTGMIGDALQETAAELQMERI